MAGFIKYGIIGSSGRLGNEVISLFNDKGHTLVLSYSIEGERIDDKPKVIIDCSLPSVFDRTIEYCNKYNSALVIATTGLSDLQIRTLKELGNKVPVVQSFNFSLGIQVLLKLTAEAKKYFPDWDVEIEETHHRFKLDKPSGTAKMIKNVFEDKNVNVTSLRLGNVFGEHTVYFGGLGEVLSIKHNATSRRTFAEGILTAAEFIVNKDKGFFNFTDIIFGDNK